MKRHKNSKTGFTLVEIIAVIAIISVLVLIVTPITNSYIIKAKKSKVIEECRFFAISIEACIAEESIKIGSGGDSLTKEAITLGQADEIEGFRSMTDITIDYRDSFSKLLETTSYKTAIDIASGKIDFKVDNKGILSVPNN